MYAFKAVCAGAMGFLLPRFLIYCYCISSLQTRYLLPHCQSMGFCHDEGFLQICNHFFLGFHKVGEFLGIAVQFLYFLVYFPLNQLPEPFSAFAVPGRPFPLVCGVEQAFNNTVSCSLSLDRCSAQMCCRLPGSFSFAEEAEIGNCIFFCCHCSCYKGLNSAVWSGRLHIQYIWELSVMNCCCVCISARSDH